MEELHFLEKAYHTLSAAKKYEMMAAASNADIARLLISEKKAKETGNTFLQELIQLEIGAIRGVANQYEFAAKKYHEISARLREKYESTIQR